MIDAPSTMFGGTKGYCIFYNILRQIMHAPLKMSQTGPKICPYNMADLHQWNYVQCQGEQVCEANTVLHLRGFQLET